LFDPADYPDDFSVREIEIAMAIMESRLLCWCVGVSAGAVRGLPHEQKLCGEALANAVVGRPELAAAVRLAGLVVTRLRVVKRGLQASAKPPHPTDELL
jgi:hypothetical protein